MLKKDYPELAKLWNYERNDKDGLYFKDVSAHSGKKLGGSAIRDTNGGATVDHISNGTRYSYCTNKRFYLDIMI